MTGLSLYYPASRIIARGRRIVSKIRIDSGRLRLKSGLVLGVPLIEIHGLIKNSRLFCLDSYLV